jgi:hypothetical protein
MHSDALPLVARKDAPGSGSTHHPPAKFSPCDWPRRFRSNKRPASLQEPCTSRALPGHCNTSKRKKSLR